MKKVVAIVGPTAIGKTSLAIEVAKKLNGEIILGDSMQVYREVAIGTAKPTKEEQAEVKHYLVDSQSVFNEYSVKNYVDQAQIAVNEIAAKAKLPLVVGGTGLYVNALINQLKLGGPDLENGPVSQKWQDFLLVRGPQELWRELNEADPDAAAKIPANNTRRVLRVLTIMDKTQTQFSQQQTKIQPRYEYLLIGLNTDREQLYQRIDQRVDQMMTQGLLKEAKFVYDYQREEHQILQAIGYKELFPYFNGEKPLAECVTQLKTASRRYAKRQLTYFRNQLPCEWFDPLADPECATKVEHRIEEWINE